MLLLCWEISTFVARVVQTHMVTPHGQTRLACNFDVMVVVHTC
jgi:hypothetical protein